MEEYERKLEEYRKQKEEYERISKEYQIKYPLVVDPDEFAFRRKNTGPDTIFKLKKDATVRELRKILCPDKFLAKCYVTTLPNDSPSSQTQDIQQLADHDQTLEDALTFKDQTVVTDEKGAIIVAVLYNDSFVDKSLI